MPRGSRLIRLALACCAATACMAGLGCAGRPDFETAPPVVLLNTNLATADGPLPSDADLSQVLRSGVELRSNMGHAIQIENRFLTVLHGMLDREQVMTGTAAAPARPPLRENCRIWWPTPDLDGKPDSRDSVPNDAPVFVSDISDLGTSVDMIPRRWGDATELSRYLLALQPKRNSIGKIDWGEYFETSDVQYLPGTRVGFKVREFRLARGSYKFPLFEASTEDWIALEAESVPEGGSAGPTTLEPGRATPGQRVYIVGVEGPRPSGSLQAVPATVLETDHEAFPERLIPLGSTSAGGFDQLGDGHSGSFVGAYDRETDTWAFIGLVHSFMSYSNGDEESGRKMIVASRPPEEAIEWLFHGDGPGGDEDARPAPR